MMTMISRTGLLMMCLMVVAGTTLAARAQSAPPCEQGSEHRALDFWLGEWQVVDADGQVVGTNRIEKGQSGCLIEERWTSASGGTGQSMNYFDPADGKWKQHWVDQGGSVVQYEGVVEEGVLRYRGRHVRRDGTVTMARVVLEPIEGGRLRHLIEHSADQGNTWSTYFDGTYVPAGEEVVAAPQPSAPAGEAPATVAEREPVAEEREASPAVSSAAPMRDGPAPAEPMQSEPAAPAAEPSTVQPAQPQASRQTVEEGSDVKAVTRELQREEIPETQAPELVMASPMILEVSPGNVADYPENSAWSTEETAGFICDEVTLQEVEVSYRTKRNRLELVVDARLFTHRRMKKVDLLVELFESDTLVASESIRKIRLGLNIPAHGEEGLIVPAVMELPEERFRALFSGESDPVFRFTITCPSDS